MRRSARVSRPIGLEAPRKRLDIAVIGAGIVGLAAAWKLLRAQPGISVVVLEKEPDVGRHQSGHNSGVLHAGLSYRPGSLKARLAVGGIRQMVRFCREHELPHDVCGKLVIATDASELPRLRELLDRGRQNGLQGLAWLGSDELREVEPHAAGAAALRVPEEGIVSYPQVCSTLRKLIQSVGGEILTSTRVMELGREASRWRLVTEHGEIAAGFLVNCAGLHADRIARLAGERPSVQVVPFRGEYYRLRAERQHLVRHLIYPVPDAAFPFLGVHLTRMIGGDVEAGPNAVLALSREGYRWGTLSLRDSAEVIAFPGLWRFLARHPKMCWYEIRRSFSRELFAAALRRLVPELEAADLEPGGAGVRAQAMTPDGQLVNDFVFTNGDRAIHLLNAPSPAATASLAIGDEIVDRWRASVGLPVAGPTLAGTA
jgi:L-2-hydroxyglutarate oxidase